LGCAVRRVDHGCRLCWRSSMRLRSNFSAPWCVGYAHDPYAWQSAWPIHVLVFGVPIAALAVGTALTWAINGFRVSDSN
jgi:hypothetical protein